MVCFHAINLQNTMNRCNSGLPGSLVVCLELQTELPEVLAISCASIL